MIKTAGLMQEEHPLQRNGGVKSPGPKARVREVLIADDEEPQLLSIYDGSAFIETTYALTATTNGCRKTAESKSKSSIDLVITDLSIPKMDGMAPHLRPRETSPANPLPETAYELQKLKAS